MKSVNILCTLLHLTGLLQAATPCRRDFCYNAVAGQGGGGPNAASRRADCSAALKVVVEDDRVLTITTLTTFIGGTTTIVTKSTTAAVQQRDQGDLVPSPQITTPPDSALGAELLPRDQFVVSGTVPSYARQCKNVQAYAIACVCYGVRAATYRAAKTTTATVRVPATVGALHHSKLKPLSANSFPVNVDHPF